MNRNFKLAGLLLGLLFAGYFIQRGSDSPSSGAAQTALERGSDEALQPGPADVLAPAQLGNEATERRDARPAERKSPKQLAAQESEDSKAGQKIEGPVLRGVVVDENGMSIPDAEVTVAGKLNAGVMLNIGAMALNETVQTDSQGRFRVARGFWPKAEVTVSVRARGHLLSETTTTPSSARGDGELGSIEAQRCVILGGVVTDSHGQGLEGAKVWRTDPGAGMNLPAIMAMASKQGQFSPSATESGPDGEFELAHELSGAYEIHVAHEDHPRGLFSGTAPEAGMRDLSLRLQLEAGATISGRLLEFPPLSKGVAVQAIPLNEDRDQASGFMTGMFGSGSENAHKGAPERTGHFVIKGLKLGEKYRLQAFVRDGIMNSVPCSAEQTANAGAEGIELQWNSGASVRFRLQDALTGQPIAAGKVRYRWTNGDQGVMANGRKMLEFNSSEVLIRELRPSPSPGAFEISIACPGYLEERMLDLLVEEYEVLELGTISLHTAPAFRVQVLEASSGKPIRRARVVLRPELDEEQDNPFFGLGGEVATGKTDREGWCSLEACSTATASLSVRRKGFAPVDLKGLAMPRDSEQSETVHLSRGGLITITVLKADGQSAPASRVVHEKPDGSEETRDTAQDGSLKYRDQVPGEHRFRASRGRRGRMVFNLGSDDDAQWQSLVLGSGAESSLSLRLPPTTSLAGRVNMRGAPVAQAKVSLLPGTDVSESAELRAEIQERRARITNQTRSSTTTDAQGEFVLDELDLGEYQLRVSRGDGAPAYFQSVDLGPSRNHVEVELPSSAVEGRVTDDRGRPIAGAGVRLRRARKEAEGEGAWTGARLQATRSFMGGSGGTKTRTDAQGHYQIEGIPTGVKYEVQVEAKGFVDGHSESFEASDNEELQAKTVKLAPAGSIKVLAAGSEMMFQTVYATLKDSEGKTTQRALGMVRNGAARITGLAPGEWRISKELDQEGQSVLVGAGEESEIELLQ